MSFKEVWQILDLNCGDLGEVLDKLKERLMANSEKVLNITYIMPELVDRFGVINDGIWEKVNDVRAA